MTKAKLQEELQGFIQEDTINVEMYLQYMGEDGNINTFLPAMEESKLSLALAKLVKSGIKNKFFSEFNDYELVSVNTAEANDIRQVFHIAKTKIPKASNIFDDVIGNKAEHFTDNAELDNVWAYIFKAETSSDSIYLFKKNYPVNLLQRDKSYAIFFAHNKLTLNDRDLLRLSTHFDVMLVNDELIILNRNEFEKAFDYVGAMKITAESNVGVISGSNLVEDLSFISNLAKNKNTLRKLLNINPNSKVLKKTPKQINSLAKKYGIEFRMNTDESKLSINTKKAALSFVELLNDNYLKSEFSDSLYKIKGKAVI